ncbi:MAG: hypothetical protein Q8J69_00600 [Sphingobacteriaceae bacterium]|nr:hypothetical protein [Sphingobacteriaceae bacterium]
MKLTSHIFAWIWMVLVLNTMFQTCFRTQGVAGFDPVNSLSELVMESLLDLEDDMPTDEQDQGSRKLKVANVLHWQCEMEAMRLGFLPALPQKQSWEGLLGICLNFSGEVLLPPPDGLPLA